MTKIDGKSISFELYEIEKRHFGQPLVILESNHASSFDTWNKVINNLGENVPILAYMTVPELGILINLTNLLRQKIEPANLKSYLKN